MYASDFIYVCWYGHIHKAVLSTAVVRYIHILIRMFGVADSVFDNLIRIGGNTFTSAQFRVSEIFFRRRQFLTHFFI